MTLVPLNIPAGVYRNGTDLQSQGRWRDANLVRWIDGTLRPVGGWRKRSNYATRDKPRGMISWADNDADRWMATGTYRDLYVYNSSGTQYNITPSDLAKGREDALAFTGFGGGAFGAYAWGVARPDTANILPATVWQLETWGENLIAMNQADGKIYEWDLATLLGDELVKTPDFASDTNWTKGNGGAGGSNWSIANGVARYELLKETFDAGGDGVINPAADTITITDHGLSDGDEVIYSVPAAPATPVAGLTDGSTYFVIGATANTFQLAATSGGAAIDLTPISTATFDANDAAVLDTAADKIVQANTFTSGDYVEYDNGGGVDIGGLTNGANYYIVAATATEFQLSLTSGGAPIDLTPDNNVTFDGNDVAVVDVASDKIIVANTFSDGDELTYDNGGGVDIGGLTAGNYFVINATATEFQLSATSGGAAITLTANNSVTVDAEDAAVVDVTTDVITIANTFTDGEIVTYDNGGGTDIAGLVNGTDYFIISASATDFQVSATSGGAAIDLTALGTGTAHVFRQVIGSAHTLDQDIGSAHLVRVDAGGGHELERQNFGNLEQIVSGLSTALVFDGDDENVVDVANDKIVAINTLEEDQLVIYYNNGGADIGGLIDGTSYYVVNLNGAEFQLSETKGGTPVTLTANNSVTIDGSDAAVVDVANDKIIVANTFTDGEIITYDSDGNTDIAGLVSGENYFVVNATASEFQLEATSGGGAIDITAVGTGPSHLFREDIGSAHDLRNTAEDENTHAILVTLTDPNDDGDAATIPSVSIKVTTTDTSTVLVEDELVVGYNRFHFDTFEGQVKVEIIPATYDTPNFEIDDVSLRVTPAADLIEEAPTGNLGVFVSEERFLFCLGSEGNPRKIRWSDREDNTTWTPSTTNEAGDIELNTTGAVMKGLRVRGQSLLLTSRDAHSATYVGPPYSYGVERVGTSCGLVALEAAIVVDAGAFWMGSNSFFTYNGSSVAEMNCEVSDYVFSDINRAQVSKIFATSNSFGEIWWFYPSADSLENDRYVVYNFVENTWYIGQLTRTAGASSGTFRLPMFFDPADKKMYEHEVGFEYGSLTPFAETGPIIMGNGDDVVSVMEMLPDERTQGDVTATFKTRFHPNGTERSYGPHDMSNPTSLRFTGRQIRMRVTGSELGDWRVGINRLDVVSGGRR